MFIKIFVNNDGYQRFVDSLRFYRYSSQNIAFNKFLDYSERSKIDFFSENNEVDKRVEILTYCLMPNHFHLILRQLIDGGISKFVGDIANAQARYFNKKYDRTGPLFEGRFKAVRIETGEQLMHVSRYLHLNPYSSGVVSTLGELEEYKWSSFPEYLGKVGGFCDKKLVTDLFTGSDGYKVFVKDHADYQRKLEEIKKLVID